MGSGLWDKPRPSLRGLSRETGVDKSSISRWVKTYFGSVNAVEPDVIRAFVVLRKRGLKFYTTPPRGTLWPWILVNVFSVDVLAGILDLYRRSCAKVESVVLDAGVSRYWRKSCTEIPPDYNDNYWKAFWEAVDRVKQLSKEFGFGYEVVVPDYPDVYPRAWGRSHALWTEECSDLVTNVDRTLENIYRLLDHDRRIPWLIPVQGYEDTPQSIANTLADMVEVLGSRRYRYGLANISTSKKPSITIEVLRRAREVCNKCELHIFRMGLHSLKLALREGLLRYGDSWDTTSWTFPRSGGFWSCKTAEERRIYFAIYAEHLFNIVSGDQHGHR